MKAARVLGVAALFASAGCEIIGGFAEFRGAAGAGVGAGDAASCPAAPPGKTTGGPEMAPAKLADGTCFWIDRTEVSVSQYDAFLQGSHPPTDGPCAGHASFDPDSTCLNGAVPGSDDPVVCVDWCDASAFCASVGKALCKGDWASGGERDATSDEWYAACSSGGKNTYPYGDYDPNACNGLDNPNTGCLADPDCTPVPVGSDTSCATPTDNPVYDMSGNVAEWVEQCSSTLATADCNTRGGSNLSQSTALACATPTVVSRSATSSSVGFRCCVHGR